MKEIILQLHKETYNVTAVFTVIVLVGFNVCVSMVV